MNFEPVFVTIPSGTAVAPKVNFGGRRLQGIMLPAAWTAADLTFQSSIDDSTYVNLYDEAGVEVNVKAAASRAVRFSNIWLWAGIKFLIVRSGTSAVPVNQAANRDIGLILSDL